MLPKHPLAKNARDKETFARDMASLVTEAFNGAGEFQVTLDDVENFAAKLIKTTSQEFKGAFINEVIEQSLAQPQNSFEGNLLILPDGVKFFYAGRKCSVVVIEHKPQSRTVTFERKAEASGPYLTPRKKTSYRLAFPYIVYVARFWSPMIEDNRGAMVESPQQYFDFLMMGYRNEPLRSLSDMLYYPNLPNMGGGGADESGILHPSVCLGESFDNKEAAIFDQLQYLMEYYWSSPFNDDLNRFWEITSKDNPKLKTLKAWEENTKINPLFMLDVEWKPYQSLENAVKYISAETQGIKPPVGLTNQHVTQVYNKAWATACQRATMHSLVKSARENLTDQLSTLMTTFATEMADGLGAIGDENLRRTVQVAMQASLKKAIKKSALHAK